MGGFWTDVNIEPKRQYRWLAYIGGMDPFLCKKFAKPKVTVSETSHKFLNHTFWYPGRADWETVAITLADPVNPDTAAIMMGKFMGIIPVIVISMLLVSLVEALLILPAHLSSERPGPVTAALGALLRNPIQLQEAVRSRVDAALKRFIDTYYLRGLRLALATTVLLVALRMLFGLSIQPDEVYSVVNL